MHFGKDRTVVTLNGRSSACDLQAVREAVSGARIIRIDPINACNAACVFCGTGFPKEFDGSRLSLHVFEAAVEAIAKQRDRRHIQFGCGYEPTLAPDFEAFGEIFSKHISARNVLRFSLVTNGRLLHRIDLGEFVQAGLNLLQVSLHHHDPDVYRKVMSRGDLAPVVTNVRDFRRRYPHIPAWVVCVVTPLNQQDIKGFIEWCLLELDVHHVRVQKALFETLPPATSPARAYVEQYGEKAALSDDAWAGIVSDVATIDPAAITLTFSTTVIRGGHQTIDCIRARKASSPNESHWCH